MESRLHAIGLLPRKLIDSLRTQVHGFLLGILDRSQHVATLIKPYVFKS